MLSFKLLLPLIPLIWDFTKAHKKVQYEVALWKKDNFLFFGKVDKFLQYFLMHSEIMLLIYNSHTKPVLYDLISNLTNLISIDNNHGGLTTRQWVGSWELTNVVSQFLLLCNKRKTTQLLIASCISIINIQHSLIFVNINPKHLIQGPRNRLTGMYSFLLLYTYVCNVSLRGWYFGQLGNTARFMGGVWISGVGG